MAAIRPPEQEGRHGLALHISIAREDDVPRLVELLIDLFGTELDFTADATAQTRGLGLLIARSPRSDRPRCWSRARAAARRSAWAARNW